MSYANSPPKYVTTLIPKTTPPFCHKWQRASHWEAIIFSLLEELASSSLLSSSSPKPSSLSSSSEACGDGDGDAVKLPRTAFLYDQHGCSPNTTHHWKCQGEHPWAQAMPWWPWESRHPWKKKERRWMEQKRLEELLSQSVAASVEARPRSI